MKKLAVLLGVLALSTAAHAGSTINNNNAFSYGANIGWINWHGSDVGQSPGTYAVNINEFFCQGWIYGANVGWISMCRKDASNPPNDVEPTNHYSYSNTGSDYGVNLVYDQTQPGIVFLRGLAYGANIGWINFDSPTNPYPATMPPISRPRILLASGKLTGYVYSANCGWVSLDELDAGSMPRYVQTDHILMGTDSNSNGIADAWEYLYFGGLLGPGGQNTDPGSTGESLLQHYQDGSNPAVVNSGLRITNYATSPSGTSGNVTFKTSVSRLYMIETKPDITAANWTPDPVFGTPFQPDNGTSTIRNVTAAAATKRFYRVKSVRPLP